MNVHKFRHSKTLSQLEDESNNLRDMMAKASASTTELRNIVEELSSTYGITTILGFVRSAVNSRLESHWIDCQPREYVITPGEFKNKLIGFKCDKQESCTPIDSDTPDKYLLHFNSLDFNQIKGLVEYCIIHNMSCHIDSNSWKHTILVELQPYDSLIKDINDVRDKQNLIEA